MKICIVSFMHSWPLNNTKDRGTHPNTNENPCVTPDPQNLILIAYYWSEALPINPLTHFMWAILDTITLEKKCEETPKKNSFTQVDTHSTKPYSYMHIGSISTISQKYFIQGVL